MFEKNSIVNEDKNKFLKNWLGEKIYFIKITRGDDSCMLDGVVKKEIIFLFFHSSVEIQFSCNIVYIVVYSERTTYFKFPLIVRHIKSTSATLKWGKWAQRWIQTTPIINQFWSAPDTFSLTRSSCNHFSWCDYIVVCKCDKIAALCAAAASH